jgi:hypothetical protein
MIPFIWFITLQNRKTLFRVFFTFKDLYGAKLTWYFQSIIISSGGRSWTLEAHMENPEVQKRTGGADKKSGRATLPLLAVDRPVALIFFANERILP